MKGAYTAVNEKKWNPVNLVVAVPIIMQTAVSVQLIWGFLGNAWAWSWLSSYIGVILCLELFFYNDALKKGNHPVKALYPIRIMLGFAFFFTCGFTVKGWGWSWIGLVLAAAGIVVVRWIERTKK